jgi:hypothetical protein
VIEIGRRPHYWYPQDADVEQLPPPIVFDESVKEVTRRAQKAIGKATFRKTHQNPHRLIARLLEEDEQRRQKLLETPYAWEKPSIDCATQNTQSARLAELEQIVRSPSDSLGFVWRKKTGPHRAVWVIFGAQEQPLAHSHGTISGRIGQIFV